MKAKQEAALKTVDKVSVADYSITLVYQNVIAAVFTILNFATHLESKTDLGTCAIYMPGLNIDEIAEAKDTFYIGINILYIFFYQDTI